MTSPGVAEITGRLGALRRAVRRLYAVHGLSRLVLAAAAAAAATFVLDWTIPELPRGVRLVFLFTGMGFLAWAVARYLLYPLRRPIADDDLAVCVERHYPELEDRLISALQLARAPRTSAGHAFNSPALVDALVAEAREAAARVDFRRVLVPRRVRRTALLAAAVAGFGAWLVASHPLYASIWFSRLLGGAAQWPRQTDLEVVDPPRFVAKGDDCVVTVRARRRIPPRATIHYSTAGAERGTARMQSLPIVRSSEGDYGEFKYEFLRVVESFHFFVRGGDDETQVHDVDVRTAPAIERLEAWFDYPDYLPLEDTPASRPAAGGNIKAPVGTVVRLRAVSNEPLVSAHIVYGSRPDKPEAMAVAPDPFPPPGPSARAPDRPDEASGPPRGPAGARRFLSGQVDVRGNDEYRIALLAENQLRNREPFRYSILAVPDAAPVIRVIEPGADRIATVDAVWPLQIAVTDDYGLRAIRLVWWLDAQPPGPEQTVDFAYPAQNDAEYRGTRIGSRHPFDLSKTGAKERDRVAYRFEALDFDASKPKPAQTRTFHFTLWSGSDLAKRLEEEMNRLRDDLRKIKESEDAIQENVTGLRDRLRDRESLEPPHKADLHAASLDQRQKVGQRVERAVRDLQEIAKTVQFNKLLDQPAMEKLERLEALLEDVAQQKSPAAGHEITEAAGARTPADRLDRFERARTLIDAIQADLRDALSMLEDWMTYQEIVRRWREVRKRQDDVNRLLLDLLQKGAPAPPKRP